MHVESTDYIFGCVYRPPDFHLSRFMDIFEPFVLQLTSSCDNVFCMGDFNINLLKNTMEPARSFMAALDALDLSLINREPTRITATASNLLDLLLTNNIELVKTCGTESANVADHELIFCSISVKVNVNQQKFVVVRDFKHFSQELFYNDFNNLPLHRLFYMERIVDKVNFLTTMILQLFDLHAPFITIRVSKQPAPWLTDNLRMLISRRKRALAKFKTTNDLRHYEKYKELKNTVNRLTQTEKRAYFDFIFGEQNSKTAWKQLKKLNISPKNSPEIPISLNDVNTINNFFRESLPHTVSDNNLISFYLSNSLLDNDEDRFHFQHVDVNFVQSIINKISTNATGHDGLNISILRSCCPYIVPFITHIINCCLLENIFPSQWKISLVRPIPKVTNPQDFKDLRPISILPLLSKILERCMESQLRRYIDENNILPVKQSGFRSSHSCATALLDVSDDIFSAMDCGLVTVLVLLDFSKAFDTISHEMLLSICSYVGLSSDACALLQSYLSDRFQMVTLDSHISNALPVSCGVPQGSILGPLLFSIYTSQLVNCISSCKFHMYADDTQLYLSFKPEDVISSCNAINNDLESIFQTSQKYSLLLNPEKSQAIVFGNISDDVIQNIKIHISGITIPHKSCVKNLGLYMDNKLRFNEHVTECVRKAYAKLKLLYHNRTALSHNLKKTLCNSLVLSSFNHCDTVYGPCLTVSDSERIQRVQNSCLRLIYGIRKYEHISHTLRHVGWLNMKNRRFCHLASLQHSIVLNKSPPYLYQKITFRTDVHHLNLRYKNVLTIPAHKTSLFRRSFKYNIANIYNGLPSVLKSKPLSNFKKSLKEIIFEKQCIV